jgi:hypothetical protein
LHPFDIGGQGGGDGLLWVGFKLGGVDQRIRQDHTIAVNGRQAEQTLDGWCEID